MHKRIEHLKKLIAMCEMTIRAYERLKANLEKELADACR